MRSGPIYTDWEDLCGGLFVPKEEAAKCYGSTTVVGQLGQIEERVA